MRIIIILAFCSEIFLLITVEKRKLMYNYSIKQQHSFKKIKRKRLFPTILPVIEKALRPHLMRYNNSNIVYFLSGSVARFSIIIPESDLDIFGILPRKCKDVCFPISINHNLLSCEINALFFREDYLIDQLRQPTSNGAFFRMIFLQKKMLIKGDEKKLRFFTNIAHQFFIVSDLEQLILHELGKIKSGRRRFYFGERYVGDSIGTIARNIDSNTLSVLIGFDEKLCAKALENVLHNLNKYIY